jgi:hypothetical protein
MTMGLLVPVSAKDRDDVVAVLDFGNFTRREGRKLSPGSHGYARMWDEKIVTLVRRWVVGAKPRDGLIVDHINGDRLAVAGLILLTTGTGGQAWANLAEYKSLMQTASTVAITAVSSSLAVAVMFGGGFGPDMPSWWDRYVPKWLALVPEILTGLVQLARLIFVGLRATLTRFRAEGGEEAVELARFLRLAGVWTIIMIGSALALAVAIIQLVLAYQ